MLYVEWVDSVAGTDSWYSKSDIETYFCSQDIKNTKTCGFFVNQDREILMLCLSISEDQFGQYILIPKKAILKLEVLHV